jgi:uncharacterized heparinase superfamily protein
MWYKLYSPRPNFSPAPRLSTKTGEWKRPARRLASMTKIGKFRFLNKEGSLCEIGWNGPQREKLWRYNQHYFDDLNAHKADLREDAHKEILQNWIDENSPGFGVGWDPYPTSLRIVNWIKWSLGTDGLSESALHSLAIQLRWLSRRLEFHLLGNHLFSNAKALVYGGLFFQSAEADEWLAKGLKILKNEVKEQILPDGAHFELSTMYHALAFEDVLDLINISKCFPNRFSHQQNCQVAGWFELAPKMHHWLKTMCHPDGEIAFFNDAAFDIAPKFLELEQYADKLLSKIRNFINSSIVHNSDSGYIRVTKGQATLFLDLAKVGPDYLPGHGHADTLTFELSFGKQRVVVNSGTSCYGVSAERLRQRGTHAHNTVVVDSKDSSEVWSGFRVAKRASPLDIRVEESEDGANVNVQGAHDGYKKIFQRPVIHRRKWVATDNNLTINDKIEGRFKNSEVRFHFHPDVIVEVDKPINFSVGSIVLNDEKKIQFSTDGSAKLTNSTWHPSFGVNQKCKAISVFFEKDEVNTIFSW